MPTVAQNLKAWDTELGWGDAEAGDAWSGPWGGVEAQWRFCVLPRLAPFLPTGTVLEIAPGHGRWTRFLKERCDRLIAVDLSPTCIDACRRRFAADRHLEYHVNDGRSLAMVEDRSVDFAFSFDSLVHADADVIAAYVEQLARKLRPDGVAFLHHSNWGAYARYAASLALIPTARLRKALASAHLIDGENHWRARDMSATRFAALAERAGLACISQELLNWNIRRLNDCISIVTPAGSRWARPTVVVRNPRFHQEAAIARRLSAAYASGRAGR